MSGIASQTIRLTGLGTVTNARGRLLVLYEKLLKELAKMPESAAYRKNTEQVIKHRKSVVEQEMDLGEIEKKLAGGQIAEILIQANNELNLARALLIAKPWESLVAPAPRNQWKWPPL